jgi:hypothetical protein
MYGDQATMDETTYRATIHKACFVRKDGKIFWVPPCRLMCGSYKFITISERNRRDKTKSVENVQRLVRESTAGFVRLIESTYINCKRPATFVDRDYGEFVALPTYIISRGWRHPDHRTVAKITALSVIQDQIKRVHGNQVHILPETYHGKNQQATFVDDEYGEFVSIPKIVIGRGAGHPRRSLSKRQKTLFGRYGVDSPLKNQEIALKVARSSNRSVVKKHWKTGEDLVCVASFESAMVEFLNRNKVEYIWQPQTFTLSNGQTYRPDLLLVDSDVYVEIKGYFREDARKKWDLFHATVPNSVIWNEAILKFMGAL